MELPDIIENIPSLLPRDPQSVLKRYIEAHQEEVEEFERRVEEVIDSHQIDNATGNELDEIGKLFGRLGKRRGRDDQDYRIYLKTVVQAFKGRGTVPGIISAVAAGLGTSEANIEVTENFKDLEYNIIIKDWPEHKGSTVEDLAELADASVAQLNRTVYKIDADEVGLNDKISLTQGLQISDSLAADDGNAVNQNLTSTADEAAADDGNAVNQNVTSAADEMVIDDSNSTDEDDVNKFRWEPDNSNENNNWDFFEWTELIEIVRSIGPDEVGFDDSLSINPNKITTSDGLGGNDASFINQNKLSVNDSAAANDSNSVNSNKVSSPDGTGLNDAAAITKTTVAWEVGDWETMEWTKEHS